VRRRRSHAIAEFKRTSPDIVLMDITMPQMEGIEAVERIVRQYPEARIVMVSSVGYQENILDVPKISQSISAEPASAEMLLTPFAARPGCFPGSRRWKP